MFNIGKKYSVEFILACVCICVAAIVISGVGIASNVIGDRAADALAADDSHLGQGVETKVVQIGLVNGVKVTVEQAMEVPARPKQTGFFGFSATDWAIFAAAFCMLALAMATFAGVRLFFSPNEW